MEEGNTIKLTINGEEVGANPGEMLIDVAQRNGVFIPKLCNHVALKPYSACRVCIVEVKKRGRAKFTASCSYPVSEGIEVNTESEEVLKLRKMTLEALMAQAPDAESIKNMAKYYGIEKSRFNENEDNTERCILCGLCVRICRERIGVSAIGFAGRGVSRKIATPFDKLSDVCITCGACETVCPTDAIKLHEISKNKPIPITSEFDLGLKKRSVIYTPFPQAMPLKYSIDREQCVHIGMGTCRICQASCGAGAVNFDQKDEELILDASSIVVAPGYDFISPDARSEFHYDRFKNVISAMEFERILNASGPFSGHIKRLSDNKDPKSMAFIQCVGSRDRNKGVGYCSSACCMFAIKEAIIAKEHTPDLDIKIYHMDIRAFGKEFDYYYERAQEMGIDFIRCRVADISEDEDQNLKVNFTDETDEPKSELFDMVVLSNGLAKPTDSEKLSNVLDIKLNEYGFCQTSSFAPLASSRAGIYIGGAFSEPKDIPDSVAQSSGAAAKASSAISLAGMRIPQISEEIFERDVSSEEPRIGVFVCHCGINIGATVNVPDVVEYARTLPNVVYVDENLYTCSHDTQEIIKEKIKEYNLNRVIVSACSPRTHEPLFQSTIHEAELNPFLFEMANIRDQCSWVHQKEPERATEKAKDLVRMAVANAKLLLPLYKSRIPVVQSGLIIGGGLSGMTAALDLAAQGYDAHLVERESILGGNLNNLYFTVYGEDVQEHLKEMISQVESNEKIHVYKQSEVSDVNGHIGNFKVTVKSKDKEIIVPCGAIILATGGTEYKPKEYLYGQNDKVLTQLELEKKLASGESDFKKLVMIQCVGCRNEERPYCSRVCCTHAVKNALKQKELVSESEIIILFKDMRTYGFREDFYADASDSGVRFIRYDDERKPEVSATNDGKLSMKILDPVLGDTLVFEPDALVLSAAIIPHSDNIKLSQMLKAQLSRDKFFLEAHMKLRPVDFSTEGMFLCGLAHSPKFINESLYQASAAVARACTIISKNFLEVGGVISEVEEGKCVACLTCVRTCPYYVPEINESGVAEIDVATCRGCGICATECPVKAIQLKHYTDEQIVEKAKALFEGEG
ncbi:MAG: FAD-dependent oxidoreductase [Thermoplasmata archaeon]|nr:MAG: FAD-dependent oxidoreductase [Thermoplasmata archaeon]